METHREFTTPIVRPLSTAPTAHPAPEVTKAARFAALQRRMQTADVETLVVVPSRTPESTEPAARVQAYEERLLCLIRCCATSRSASSTSPRRPWRP